MTRLLNQELKQVITNPNFRYTILMMTDAKIRALGFDWDGNRNSWVNTIAGALGAGDPKGTVNRLINMCVIATPNNELGDLTGQGIIATIGGELIKWNNGQFYAAGNIDAGYNVTVTGKKTMKNGIAYYTDNLLLFSAITPGKRLEALASQPNSPYYHFFQYLKNSKLYTASTGAITGVPLGFFGTFLIPDSNAIKTAVNAGLLPGTVSGAGKVPNYTPTAANEIEQVESFLKFHILQQTVIADGKVQDSKTNFTNLSDQTGVVNVITSAGGGLSFKDSFGNIGVTDPANSNVLADRIVIHSINRCLQPNK
jgi:hypothetical protein